LEEFGFDQDQVIILWYENQSAIHISRNPIEQQHIKHIEVHMHVVHQHIQDGIISLEYLMTQQKIEKIFTKPFSSPYFLELHGFLGVKEVILGGC